MTPWRRVPRARGWRRELALVWVVLLVFLALLGLAVAILRTGGAP
jgi:hypothetical protein